jgi:hypothetical protein
MFFAHLARYSDEPEATLFPRATSRNHHSEEFRCHLNSGNSGRRRRSRQSSLFTFSIDRTATPAGSSTEKNDALSRESREKGIATKHVIGKVRARPDARRRDAPGLVSGRQRGGMRFLHPATGYLRPPHVSAWGKDSLINRPESAGSPRMERAGRFCGSRIVLMRANKTIELSSGNSWRVRLRGCREKITSHEFFNTPL